MPNMTDMSRDAPKVEANLGRNTRPFAGIDLRTARGRRVRDLYRGYADQIGGADDPIVTAATIKVAVLQVIVERIQNELIRSTKHNLQLGDELVRHENLLRRAKAELAQMKPKTIPWWERSDAEEENE